MISPFCRPAALVICIMLMMGCASRYELSHLDPTPYFVHEGGQSTRVRVASFWSYPPSWAVAAGKNSIILTSSMPPSDDQAKIKRFISGIAPWHRLNEENSLTTVANAMGRAAGTDNRLLWVVSSNNPVVLAVGVQMTPPFLRYGASFERDGKVKLEGTVKLISADDINEQVSDLLILDQWPGEIHWDTRLSYAPRRVHFPEPTLISKVMESAMWK